MDIKIIINYNEDGLKRLIGDDSFPSIIYYDFTKSIDNESLFRIYNNGYQRKLSLKFYPINWDNVYDELSLPNITFSNNTQYKNVYFHNVKLNNKVNYDFILHKFKHCNIYIYPNCEDDKTLHFFDSLINENVKILDLSKKLTYNEKFLNLMKTR